MNTFEHPAYSRPEPLPTCTGTVMKLLLLPVFFALGPGAWADPIQSWQPHWQAQDSHVTARLRGISATSDNVVWSSGSDNTVLRSADGGHTWQRLTLPAEMTNDPLDFRDIDAVDANTAYLLAIGPGSASRIYKTSDAGKTWTRQYLNADPKGFLDSMTFWDATHGLVIGDAIDGHLQILATEDGGLTWNRIDDSVLPAALPNEGAFSASGSNIAVAGDQDAWIGMGAITRSRLLHTADRGKTWTVTDTPLATSESAGIFSVAFRDTLHGVIVGGDYKQENLAVNNVAITSDGGKTWQLVTQHGLSGYRSVVKYLPGNRTAWVAIGPRGADVSIDDGNNWAPVTLPSPLSGFDTLSFVPGQNTGYASGDRGSMARLNFGQVQAKPER